MERNDGFTLIELLAATTLFIVAISLASGTFISSIRSQRSVVALMAANDNASLSIERIAREIRIGSNFSTNRNGTELNFISQRVGNVSYKFEEEEGVLMRNGVPVTSDNVLVKYLFFDLMGEGIGDGQSTRVTVRIGISAHEEAVRDVVTQLQTTVSSRQLDT